MPATPQPTALLYGRAQVIVHGNPAFVTAFGREAIGLPASEALVGLPSVVFDVVERVRTEGRPLAAWIEVDGRRRRLTVAPRADVETGEVYGVALRLAEPPVDRIGWPIA